MANQNFDKRIDEVEKFLEDQEKQSIKPTISNEQILNRLKKLEKQVSNNWVWWNYLNQKLNQIALKKQKPPKKKKKVEDKTPISIHVKTEELRPTKAHIINHNLHVANRWYEIKLPRDAVTWQVRARGNHEILYSYSPTHQTYMTLAIGEVFSADTAPNAEINAVYVMSEEGNIVCELEVWRK